MLIGDAQEWRNIWMRLIGNGGKVRSLFGNVAVSEAD